MEKLYNYLVKIGVNESHTGARPEDEKAVNFYRETYARNYFYNVPAFTFPGVLVSFDYNVEAAPGYFRELARIEKKIKSYCARYGYNVGRASYCFGCSYFTIWKASDVEKARIYDFYADAARGEFEKMQHRYIMDGTPEKINDAGREIMDAYGDAYKERIKADAEKKTA